jgi:hypothetical protein
VQVQQRALQLLHGLMPLLDLGQRVQDLVERACTQRQLGASAPGAAPAAAATDQAGQACAAPLHTRLPSPPASKPLPMLPSRGFEQQDACSVSRSPECLHRGACVRMPSQSCCAANAGVCHRMRHKLENKSLPSTRAHCMQINMGAEAGAWPARDHDLAIEQGHDLPTALLQDRLLEDGFAFAGLDHALYLLLASLGARHGVHAALHHLPGRHSAPDLSMGCPPSRQQHATAAAWCSSPHRPRNACGCRRDAGRRDWRHPPPHPPPQKNKV